MITKGEKRIFLEELQKTGNIRNACKKLGVHRSTYYRWRSNPWFKKLADEALVMARSDNCDIAEYMLMKKVSEGDLPAIKFYLLYNSSNYKAEKEAKQAKENQRTFEDLIYEHAAKKKEAREVEEKKQEKLGIKRPPKD